MSQFEQYPHQMKSATSNAEVDELMTKAFRSYVSDNLTDEEYATLYSMGTAFLSHA